MKLKPRVKTMRPCVRCLCKKITEKSSGVYFIAQCFRCGFNTTALDPADARSAWNGFRVWGLVKK